MNTNIVAGVTLHPSGKVTGKSKNQLLFGHKEYGGEPSPFWHLRGHGERSSAGFSPEATGEMQQPHESEPKQIAEEKPKNQAPSLKFGDWDTLLFEKDSSPTIEPSKTVLDKAKIKVKTLWNAFQNKVGLGISFSNRKSSAESADMNLGWPYSAFEQDSTPRERKSGQRRR
jgi:hypothetical protein